MALKTIPLNLDWCDTTRQDFAAVYLRRKQDNWGTPHLDAHGREQWDTTGPLPMRRHSDWLKKGYRYLTLAIDRADHRWPMVAAWIRQQTGDDPETYIQDLRRRSTFSVDLWSSGAAAQADQDFADLQALVAQYGPEVVTAIKRQENPHYELPAVLRGDAAAEGEPAKRGPGRPRKTEAVA